MERLVSESKLIISEVMLPNQANVAGNIHGGEIMKLMDLAAYAVARRFAHTNVVTTRVDEGKKRYEWYKSKRKQKTDTINKK